MSTVSFGQGTDKKTKAFQKAKGLVGDGIIGAATWAELEKKPQPKSVVSKPAQKEEEDMEQTAVVINGTADVGTATLLAFQLGCGLFFRKDAEKRRVSKEIYITGGGKVKIKGDKLINLSGKTCNDTAKSMTAQFK